MKINLKKIKFDKTATWNVWMQLGLDIDTDFNAQHKLDVTSYCMTEENQDKIINHMIENNEKLSCYKSNDKEWITKTLLDEQLYYFPSVVKVESK